MQTNTKAGARHSASDRQDMQMMHDLAVKQGAMCSPAMKALSAPWSAVKATADGRIEGLLIRFTSPAELDAAGDYFDQKTITDLETGDELPLLWHHGLDPEIGKQAIGKGSVKLTKAGWWFTAWLNKRDEYEAYMLELAKRGKLGYSSGADPASVVRQRIPGKAYGSRIARWDVLEGSLTPIPADFANQVNIKSLLGTSDRQRRLALELELLAIETEHARALALHERANRLRDVPRPPEPNVPRARPPQGWEY